MQKLQSEDATGGVLCDPLSLQENASNTYKTAMGLAAYGKYAHAKAILSARDFLAAGVGQIVEESIQESGASNGCITSLVNGLIRIVEESYVSLPRNRYVELSLEKLIDQTISFVKATDYTLERKGLSQLVDNVDEFGFTLVIFYGDSAAPANLKLRVLSRLLLVAAAKPVLNTGDKVLLIDFDRLGRIRAFRKNAR